MNNNIDITINKIKKDLINYIQDRQIYLADLYEDNFQDEFYSFPKQCSINCRLSEGATKGVFIFPDEGFVLKTPFYTDGCYEYCGAPLDNGCNYCQGEEDIYYIAKERGFGDCLIEIKETFEINGHPFYIQPIATIFNSVKKSNDFSSKEIENRISSITHKFSTDCCQYEWLEDFYNYFGEEKFTKFFNFMETVEIDDLHSGNVGYYGNRPCIIDYGSYRD